MTITSWALSAAGGAPNTLKDAKHIRIISGKDSALGSRGSDKVRVRVCGDLGVEFSGQGGIDLELK